MNQGPWGSVCTTRPFQVCRKWGAEARLVPSKTLPSRPSFSWSLLLPLPPHVPLVPPSAYLPCRAPIDQTEPAAALSMLRDPPASPGDWSGGSLHPSVETRPPSHAEIFSKFGVAGRNETDPGDERAQLGGQWGAGWGHLPLNPQKPDLGSQTVS